MTSHTISSPRLPGGNTELRCPHNKSQRHSAAPTKERYMEWSHRSDNSTPSGRLLAPVSRARSEERDRHTLQADDRVCGRYCFSQVYWFCVRSVTSSRGKSEENRMTGAKEYITSDIATHVDWQVPFYCFKKKMPISFLYVILHCITHALTLNKGF